MVTTDTHTYSIVGQKRSVNQDSVGFHEPTDDATLENSGRLYVVADGAGGHARGDVASQLAVKILLENYYQLPDSNLGARLTQLFQRASGEIGELAGDDPHQRMATTLVATVIHRSQLIVANVGDSRAYMIRRGKVLRLTKDHSLVQSLIDGGALTDQEARDFQRKNILSRSISGDPNVEVDIMRYGLHPGDIILMCSDGLSQYFWDDAELLPYIDPDSSAETIAHTLVNEANDRGGSDNISAIVVKISIDDGGDTAPLKSRSEHVAPTRPVKIVSRPESSPQAASAAAPTPPHGIPVPDSPPDQPESQLPPTRPLKISSESPPTDSSPAISDSPPPATSPAQIPDSSPSPSSTTPNLMKRMAKAGRAAAHRVTARHQRPEHLRMPDSIHAAPPDEETGGGLTWPTLLLGALLTLGAVAVLVIVGQLAWSAWQNNQQAAIQATERAIERLTAAAPTSPPPPTETPAATATPVPTATAEPTATPQPTATATPTPIVTILPPVIDLPICAWRVASGDTLETITDASLGDETAPGDHQSRRETIVILNDLETPPMLEEGQIVLVPWTNPAQPIVTPAPATLEYNGTLYPNCHSLAP